MVVVQNAELKNYKPNHKIMKCDLKTMLKVGAILAGVLAVGFFAFPQFRPIIIGLAPFALFALCPLSMIFMMGKMGDKNKDGQTGDPNQHV